MTPDDQAAAWIAEHQGNIWAVVRRRVMPSRADDAYQEACIAILKVFRDGRVSLADNPGGFLQGVVNRACVAVQMNERLTTSEAYKGRTYDPQRTQSDQIAVTHIDVDFGAEESRGEGASTITDPALTHVEPGYDEVEGEVMVDELLAHLEPQARHLALARSQGIGTVEYAEQEGLTERAVRQRWTRLRRQLADDLAELAPTGPVIPAGIYWNTRKARWRVQISTPRPQHKMVDGGEYKRLSDAIEAMHQLRQELQERTAA